MDASLFVRLPNVTEYSKMGVRVFSALPRVDEFISAEVEGKKKYFQVIAVHHESDNEGAIEIYAVQTEPMWEAKKGRAIGFGS